MERLKECWRERCAKYDANCREEVEEKEQQKKESEWQLESLKRMNETRSAWVREKVALNEEAYASISSTPAETSTSPLLLDCIVTPVQEEGNCTCTSDTVLMMKCKSELRKARYERNRALHLAQQYRSMAEQSQSEKRDLKHALEGQIEVVRDFWRNKIVEGGTRSGRILREALIRN